MAPKIDLIVPERHDCGWDGGGSRPIGANVAVKDGKIAHDHDASGHRESEGRWTPWNVSGSPPGANPTCTTTLPILQLDWDPLCHDSGWHGRTSVANRQCGFGFCPVASRRIKRPRRLVSLAHRGDSPFEYNGKRSCLGNWEKLPSVGCNSVGQTPSWASMSAAPFGPLQSQPAVYVMASKSPRERGLCDRGETPSNARLSSRRR